MAPSSDEKVWTPAMFVGGPSSLAPPPGPAGRHRYPAPSSSGFNTPTSATFSFHSDTDDEYRGPDSAQVYRRRRSTIVPEKIFGDPVGKGPLRIGAFFRPTKPEHQLMSWVELLDIITRGDLEHLLRHPDCEREYMSWAKSIKRHYGGLEQYIATERIGWGQGRPQEGGEAAASVTGTESPQLQSTFFDDEAAAAAESENSSVVRVVFNDWPYAIPLECQHYVVWSRYQIIDPGLFETPDTPFPAGPLREVAMRGIIGDGIRGATGADDFTPIGDRTPVFFREALEGSQAQELLSAAADIFEKEMTNMQRDSLDDQVFVLSKMAHKWAARFVNRFIEQHWAVDDYETAWFCNPPHLRTVPGLSHFHVIVRPRPPPQSLLLSET